MTTFVYPSEEFPTTPSVTLEAGANWVGVIVPGAVMALRSSTDQGQFAPNIAVLAARHLPGMTIAAELDAIAQDAQSRVDGRTDEVFEAEIHDRRYGGRVTVFRDDVAGTIAQVHLVTVVDQGPACDVVHLVGTCAGDRVDTDLPELRDVMSTVRVGP